MTEAIPLSQLAALSVMSVVLYEVLRQLVTLLMGRLFAPGFVKVSDCKKCSADQIANDDGVRRDIKAIKKILVVMATRGEVGEDDLKALVG